MAPVVVRLTVMIMEVIMNHKRKVGFFVTDSHSDPSRAIVPLEAFDEPRKSRSNVAVYGASHFPALIDAASDKEAVTQWLSIKGAGSPHTYRAYRREAERFLLWSRLELGKSFAELTVDDCARYRDWLSLLGRCSESEWPFAIAQHAWIGKRNIPRYHPDWRPFEGPLSPVSVRYAVTVVMSLFEWLAAVRYLLANPWVAVGRKSARYVDSNAEIELTRVFSRDQWQEILDFLSQLPENEATARMRFVMVFAKATGLRLAEIVLLRVAHLYVRPLRRGGTRLMVKVLGKGGKWRAVPFPPYAQKPLQAYFAFRGLSRELLRNPPETPLVAALGTNSPLSPNAFYKTVKKFFRNLANRVRQEGNESDASHFERASPHWLRHTCGAHLAASGVPVNLVQQLLGHASLATTSIYTVSDEERLWEAVVVGRDR